MTPVTEDKLSVIFALLQILFYSSCSNVSNNNLEEAFKHFLKQNDLLQIFEEICQYPLPTIKKY